MRRGSSIFNEFMLKYDTPQGNVISLLLFNSMIDDPVNRLLNHSKIMKELFMHIVVVRMKHKRKGERGGDREKEFC